jgi:hypothetical protein
LTVAHDAGTTPASFQHPQAVELADQLDDAGKHELEEHPIAFARAVKAQHLVGTPEGLQQAAHPRGRDRQRPPGRAASVQAEIKLALPRRHPLTGYGLQHLQLGVVVRRPDVLDIPRPRRDEYTTCTAVAPDPVFTVRTYGDTGQVYGPALHGLKD